MNEPIPCLAVYRDGTVESYGDNEAIPRAILNGVEDGTITVFTFDPEINCFMQLATDASDWLPLRPVE